MAQITPKKVNNSQDVVGNVLRVKSLDFQRSNQIDIRFNNLTYRVPERSHCSHRGFKTILKNVSGDFASGQLSAVMGPSGAGKTSLLNVLAGYIHRGINGTVMLNDKQMQSRDMRKISAYIMQDDRLQVHLTVMEALTFASNLKVKPSKDRVERINNILIRLGLEEARNTIAASLSGGQKKRLAIALELINNPPVMFFDEPTSGLDSQTSYQVVALMKKLAQAGRTIICTIHQPSARLFEIFDNLYVLQGGQAIYNGETAALIPFLAQNDLICPKYHNPADFIMEVASGEFGQDCVTQLIIATSISEHEKMNKSYSTNSIVVDGYRANIWRQFYTLVKRQMMITFRNPLLFHLKLASHILVGLVFGGLCYQIGNQAEKIDQNVSFVFLSMLFLLFSSMMPTLMQFPSDLRIMIAEYQNRWYSASAYFLAKTLSDLPFSILFDMIFTVIAYFLSGQPIDTKRFFLFNSIVILCNAVTQSMGLLIGAASPSLEASTFVGPICAIPVLLFAGFFIKASEMAKGWQWLTYVSYFRYCFEAVLIALYGDIGDGPRPEFDCNDNDAAQQIPPECEPLLNMTTCPTPSSVLDQFDIDEKDLTVHCIVILIFFLALRFCAFAALTVQIFFHSQSAGLRIQYLIHRDEFKEEYENSLSSSQDELAQYKNNRRITNDLSAAPV